MLSKFLSSPLFLQHQCTVLETDRLPQIQKLSVYDVCAGDMRPNATMGPE